jgi:hypothetical protein
MVDDPVLGALVPDADGGCWTASLALKGATVRFTVGGYGAPDPQLVSRAREISRGFGEFQTRVRSYLEGSARAQVERRALAPEIASLQIETIMFAWPDRPQHGMVFFTGASEGREWHCDMIGEDLRDLACDT